jgi:hypothetical protein
MGWVAMYDYEDSPMALLQLMNDLEKAGFHADFKLHDGLEVTIRTIRKPVITDSIRV